MPRIKLSNHPKIRFDFFAHIVWPNNENKRKAYIALINEASIAYLEEAQLNSRFRPIFVEGHYDLWASSVRDAFEADVLEPGATSKAVSQGYGLENMEKEILKHAPDMFLAGYTAVALATMLQHHSNDSRLNGGPGIKKAQDVIARSQVCATTKVENAWSKYKTVAHFCASAVILSNTNVRGMVDLLLNPTEEFKSASQYYRILLTTFIAKRARATLVDGNDIWLPPTDWDGDGIKLIGPPLPEHLLDELETRTSR